MSKNASLRAVLALTGLAMSLAVSALSSPGSRIVAADRILDPPAGNRGPTLGLPDLTAYLLARQRPAGADGRGAAQGTGIEDGVLAALESAPQTSVIVSLAISAPRPDGGPAPADIPGLRRDVSEARARVLAALPAGSFHVRRQYEAVPAVAGEITMAGIRALESHPDVQNIALDRRIFGDLAEAVPLINADDAHTFLGVTGAGISVAVLDTGIDAGHPLLGDDVSYQICFLASGLCPGGGTTGPYAWDGNGHGTHVSGIITSAGPPVGAAPDAFVEAFKVLDDDGSGTFSDILAALDHIISYRPSVRLINMSLGDGGSYGQGTCDGQIPAFDTAIATTRAMGITTFVAAGNNGSKAGLSYPACVRGVVSVGAVYDADVGFADWSPVCFDATTGADLVTCFSQSSYGLDLLAPGATIQSTVPGGGLSSKSGTSMASPMAAGAAALVLQSEPWLTPLELQTRLQETGVPVTDPANGVTTCRVDAYAAVIGEGTGVCQPAPCSFDRFDDRDDCENDRNTYYYCASPPGPGPGATRNTFRSDVNRNGLVDITDPLTVRAFTYSPASAGLWQARSDINCNESVASVDLVLAKVNFDAVVGPVTAFPGGGTPGPGIELQCPATVTVGVPFDCAAVLTGVPTAPHWGYQIGILHDSSVIANSSSDLSVAGGIYSSGGGPGETLNAIPALDPGGDALPGQVVSRRGFWGSWGGSLVVGSVASFNFTCTTPGAHELRLRDKAFTASQGSFTLEFVAFGQPQENALLDAATVVCAADTAVGGIAELPEIAVAARETGSRPADRRSLVAGVTVAVVASSFALVGAAWRFRRRGLRRL